MEHTIAFITSQAYSLYNFRGPLLRLLVSKGYKVYALAPDYADEDIGHMQNFGVIPVKISLSRTGMNPIKDFMDIVKLYHKIKEIGPQIVLSYFIKPVIYGSIAAKIAGVHDIYSMIEGLGYVFMDYEKQISIHKKMLRKMVSIMYHFSLKYNKKVFILNSDDEKVLLDERIVKSEKLALIPGIGVDIENYRFQKMPKNSMSFIFIGRMLIEKGVWEFIRSSIEILKSYPSVKFIMLGGCESRDGSIKAEDIENAIRGTRIIWMGAVPDVRPFLADSNVFVLPSYREGLPRSAMEAMAMGRPIISTNVPGCRETVIEGRNGFLVPARDLGKLAEAMAKFIDNPMLAEKMGKESRKICEDKFDVRKINSEIIKVMNIG